MRTRREILKTAGKTAAILTTTAPWWLVRRAHAARQAKLVGWNPAALAPQVDKIMQEQCYAYAKQAGIKESEIDYQIIGGPQLVPKLVAALEPRKTWEEFVEVCKKVQKPPKLTGFGLCLGLQNDTDNNVMNMIWCHGGKLVEADNKTVALHSKGTIAAVQLIADMFNKHKIIPKGAIAWDNTGNNKAYQSRQVIFVLNPTSIYAHLADSDKELYKFTGLLPVPAGAGRGGEGESHAG